MILSEAVPGCNVDLAIALAELKELPANASYYKKNGRASVDVRLGNDTIYISGTCDSLQRLVNYYERLFNQSSRHEFEKDAGQKRQHETEVNKKTDPPWMILIVMIIPVILIAGLIILIRISYKHIKT